MGRVNQMLQDQQQLIADKITHLLSIYPIISPSMLQIGLGTSLPPTIWKPVLMELIESDVIKREESSLLAPNGQCRNYTKLSLVNGQTS